MNHYLLNEGYLKCDLVKHDVMSNELRVTIYKLRVETLKARVEIQKGEFESSSWNQQVTSSNSRYTSLNPRIIKSMKTQLNSFKRPSFPKMTIPKLVGNSWGSSSV